ncbi:Ulp1-like peptidase [Cucumis melo var. makuwa]|uniref:Ulp1-like peptidase n=1 Tax=Cucumis melo var. makuwa TaxID=1194695 RepID=A0A5A7V908_CUCMM|nr:Ulp1-like peptidase [Cucumis melo var. makuwa]TYK26604.1 Ulp1-like peptidase [Cucumis melo var. makuwa]
MFRKTIFGNFLDVKLVFNEPLYHFILLREVEEGRENTNSFKLLGEKVSFRREDFDDGMKMSVFYFIELAMICPEKRQYMNWTMLAMIDDRALNGKVALHKKKPAKKKSLESYTLYEFPFAFQAYEIVSSISGWVTHRELSSAIPCIMWWSCAHLLESKARIHEIKPTDGMRAYLDRSLETSSFCLASPYDV